jgi:hypothetical protein
VSTTLEDLKRWFDNGVKLKRTHMVVVCDTFDYEDYPVYVGKGEDLQSIIRRTSGPNMTRVMEVYNLTKPWPEMHSGRVMDTSEAVE